MEFQKGHKINVGRRLSEITKKKIGDANRGNAPSNKGKNLSEEWKRKISIANKGQIVTKEQRKKISEAKLGVRLSEKHRYNISIANKGKKKPPFTQEHRRKIGLASSKRVGELSSRWKGGITFCSGYRSWSSNKRNRLKRALNLNGSSHTFGEWELLKKQYGFMCPSCKKQEPEIKLTEDHIVPLSKGGSDNIENIQPLCMSCNSKKHTKKIKY